MEKRAEKELEGVKCRFYYIRDRYRHPVVTVCILGTVSGAPSARGISIKSPFDKDRLDKAEGRRQSYERAKAAFRSSKTEEPILRDDLLDYLNEETDWVDYQYEFKSEFDPTMSAHEEKILGFNV